MKRFTTHNKPYAFFIKFCVTLVLAPPIYFFWYFAPGSEVFLLLFLIISVAYNLTRDTEDLKEKNGLK